MNLSPQTDRIIRLAILGIWLGFALSQIGFSNFEQLHSMFTFSSFRILFAFAASLVISVFFFKVIIKNRLKVHRPLHKGSIVGGIIFGAGWAVAGACPSIPFIQLGEGKLLAVFTILGIFVGIKLHQFVQAKYLNWDTGSCID